jgi:hypothetical protein
MFFNGQEIVKKIHKNCCTKILYSNNAIGSI